MAGKRGALILLQGGQSLGRGSSRLRWGEEQQGSPSLIPRTGVQGSGQGVSCLEEGAVGGFPHREDKLLACGFFLKNGLY